MCCEWTFNLGMQKDKQMHQVLKYIYINDSRIVVITQWT